MTVASNTADKKLGKKVAKRSVRKARRAVVAKAIDRIEAADPTNAEIIKLAHQAMYLLEQEENSERRNKWEERLKKAVIPALEDMLITGDQSAKVAALQAAAKLIDSPGEHMLEAKRYEYGQKVVESLTKVLVGKIELAADLQVADKAGEMTPAEFMARFVDVVAETDKNARERLLPDEG